MTQAVEWLTLDDERVGVLGLPWFDRQTPAFHRLPREDGLPDGVVNQQRFAAGARLQLRSSTSQLLLRAKALSGPGQHGIEMFVDGVFWACLGISQAEQTLACFSGLAPVTREITFYLPYRRAVQVLGLGVDPETSVERAANHLGAAPLVLYGSSVAQGVGASRASLSYIAVLARLLRSDFVNLGFGGAGKAEASVVALVAACGSRCFILDLGKSYGKQDADAYVRMLAQLRTAHPRVPIACVTPVFATREFYRPDYVELSEHTRTVVRHAVCARRRAGDSQLLLLDGLDLLGPQDTDGFAADGVHPNDLGHSRIAARLREPIQRLLGSNACRPGPTRRKESLTGLTCSGES